MDTIRICKTAGDQIIDTFWSVGAGISILDKCREEAHVERNEHGYVITIALDGEGGRSVCLPVQSERIGQVKAWLAGTGYRHRNLLDVLCGKI